MNRSRTALALAAALALTLGACSASGGSSDAAGTTTTSADRATTTVAEKSTTTEATTTTTAPDGDVFRNSDAGYEISVGSDWEEGDTSGQADQLWFVAPADATFRPNVNVLLQPTSGNDLADYRTDTAAGLESALGDAKLLRSVLRVDDDGTERDVFEYTGTAQGLDLHFFATTVISGDNFVLATFSTTEDRWDDLSPDVIDHLLTLRPI